MLVYRVCSQQEVEMIFDKGIENIYLKAKSYNTISSVFTTEY